MEIVLSPIGFVRSCFVERFGTPRQSGLAAHSWCEISLRPELNLNDALIGLDGYSHLWVIFVFHKNTNKGFNAKVHPPRLQGQSVGAFATRTPHRPNPIGMSLGKIEKISDDKIRLSGIDILDGSPVLDIKPYVQEDSIKAEFGWSGRAATPRLSVHYSKKAENDLLPLARGSSSEYRALVEEIVSLDPRPGFYKGTSERPNPYTDIYGVRVEDTNVVFRVTDNQAEIVEIQPWPSET